MNRRDAVVLGSILALLGSVFGPCALAAKLTDKERTHIGEPRPPGVPSDEDMVAAGAIIGDVLIDINDIFNTRDPRENNGLFRLANTLHINTKQVTIARQLLFRAGDKFDPQKLAETERNLRLLSYVYDAHVTPVKYQDGRVTVLVSTKDVWTLSPGISFGRSGGKNTSRFDLEESNLFGWGKKIQISHGSDVERTSTSLDYYDANLFGTRWTMDTAYEDSDDGSAKILSIGQPFYALSTPWSTTFKAFRIDHTVPRYYMGNIFDEFQRDETYYEASGGVSSGLIDGWTRRFTAGVRYDRKNFSPARTLHPSLNPPPDRTVSYPYVGFSVVEDDYRKVGDQDQIGRTEDLYFGTQLNVELGYSNTAFSATRNAPIVNASGQKGLQLTPLTQLFLTSTFTSRFESGKARNLYLDGTAAYYWRWHRDKVFFAFLGATTTHRLDPDAQLTIGGDSGLRGYPLRFETGNSRALLTLEQRFYTSWYPFRLARFGAAIFTDVGRTWGSGPIGNSNPGALRDVGFGLRFGNTRTGLGNVLHIDFAYPINEPSVSKLQVNIQTKESF